MSPDHPSGAADRAVDDGPLPTVAVTRYVTPLREGGSLPGIVEADDLGTYVCKFRGAGQGVRVLVAEVVVAELARLVGLRTPRLVALELDAEIARYEADEEVQDLLVASVGLNLGVDFLPGSFGYDGERAATTPGGGTAAVAEEAARVLWLDAFCANVDRSWRNPNLLVWHDDLWVIDHGASLYFHHAWSGGVTDPARFAAQRWDVSDHVLGAHVGGLGAVDAAISDVLTPEVLPGVLERVPDAWLQPVPGAETPAALRAAYVAFLTARLGTRQWLPGADA
ncbi:HipA family kinase [Nocardioides kribbensis]|uniref:HipA family kinase n=1 Tax=Nocardioides kribbensis TaxID=305517 RepID=UPI0029D40FE1|nr:HipA family kinase [Nocardioides kribbensis]